MINLKQIAADPRIVRLAMLLSQYTPERIGHKLSWWVASTASRLRPAV